MLYAHVFIIFVFAIMKKYHYSSIQRTLIAFFVCSLTTVLAAGQSVLVRTYYTTRRHGQCHQPLFRPAGYLWLGTNLVAAFDGYRFVNFYHENGGTRRMENVTGIVEDTVQNRLLVRHGLLSLSFRPGILEADTRRFPVLRAETPVDEPAIVRRAWERGVSARTNTPSQCSQLCDFADGNEIWTTIDNGFYVYDTNLINHLRLSIHVPL